MDMKHPNIYALFSIMTALLGHAPFQKSLQAAVSR